MSQTNQVPVRPPSREKVYDVIDGERDYQNAGQGNASPHVNSSHTAGKLTPEGGLVCLEHILSEARATWYKPGGDKVMMPLIRKIAGVAVQLMENYGAQPREYHVPASANITGEMRVVDPGDKLVPNRGPVPYHRPNLGFPQT